MHSGVQALPRPCPRRHPGRLLQDQEDQAQEQALQPGPRSLPRAPRTRPKPRRPRTVPGTPRTPRPHATGFREAPRAAGPAGVPLLGPPGRPAPSCQLSRPAERPRRSPPLRLPPGALQRRAGSSCGSQPPPITSCCPPSRDSCGSPRAPRSSPGGRQHQAQAPAGCRALPGRRRPRNLGCGRGPRTHCPGAWGTRGTAAVLSFLRAPQASGSPVRRPHPCAHLSLCLLRTPGRTRLLIQFLFYDDADEGEVE
ncbi:translation initiation factor IF-2-like isoform X2 [Canis lupus dingo]|uniref:translation initiation factor IF-2-like isoform X2 n=1 Tax=Canis lupus dingo TaxID=286419 RepID=UPI0020C4CFC1|nr:translation initiation factor IF-2-like isoform X2 [Canis lupus dingo]